MFVVIDPETYFYLLFIISTGSSYFFLLYCSLITNQLNLYMSYILTLYFMNKSKKEKYNCYAS